MVPDAPVSKFELTMQGGNKGLLVNNTELCKAKPVANVAFDGTTARSVMPTRWSRSTAGRRARAPRRSSATGSAEAEPSQLSRVQSRRRETAALLALGCEE